MTTRLIRSRAASLLVASLLAGLTACDDTPTAAPTITADPVTPDLVFTPAALRVAPGDTARAVVRVITGADLRQATFAVEHAPAGLDVRFVPDAEGRTGTLLLVSHAPLAPSAGGLTIRGVSGPKVWVGRLALAVSASPARTLFANAAAGKDANAGTAASPLRTLGRALALATAGDTVQLSAGSYTNTGSGDVYPLHVPSGVTVRGTLTANGGKGTFLSPASSAARTPGLILDGNATVQDLELDVFGVAIDARQGTARLRNLNFILNETALFAAGSADVTLTTPQMFLPGRNGALVRQRARLTLDGGKLDAAGQCANGPGLLALDSTALTVRNATFAGFSDAVVSLGGDATGTLTNVDVTSTGAPCPLGSSVHLGDAARLTLVNVRASGVKGVSGSFANLTGSATLVASRLRVSNHFFGIQASQLSNVTLTGSTFEQNGFAVIGNLGARVGISSSQFTGNETAVRAVILRLRTSTVRGGKVGIEAQSELVDLGGFNDPGLNVLQGSSDTEVRFAPPQGGRELAALGNTWNGDTQFAPANGVYNISLASSRGSLPTGRNFKLVEPVGATEAVRIRLNP
jgi:hypothetical protein